ncbi:MAG: helix-turn-helix transcriptional regulator [Nitrospirae bacterium]|nr:helix-turn-helix transcriptional regulator [Candidatus Manganitrophaceae bacterium]
MFLDDRKVEGLLGLIRWMSLVPPWKDPKGFLAAVQRVVPYDRLVAFMKVDPKTHQIIPSPFTLTNLNCVDSLQEHNSYFWKFKQPIIDRIAENQFHSFHVPTTLSILLTKHDFQEYQFDYWEKYKIRFSYACYTKTPQGYLATYFTRSGEVDFSPEEKKILDLLAPHLELIACAAIAETATLFVDAKGALLWTDVRAETVLNQDLSFAGQLRQTLPVWLGRLALDPLKPLRVESQGRSGTYSLVLSQAGYGRFPLFKVCWTAKKEKLLPAGALNAFAQEHQLSPREREILALAVAGKQMKEMAQQLGLGLYTVKEYLGSVYRKAGVDGKGPLVAKVLSQVSFEVSSGAASLEWAE